jgi:hypothetical protein
MTNPAPDAKETLPAIQIRPPFNQLHVSEHWFFSQKAGGVMKAVPHHM